MTYPIGVLIGSLRSDSFNKKLANELMRLAAKDFNFSLVEIGQLPLYNQDGDNQPPNVYVQFRNAIKKCAGLLFVTPEYNRSIPGVLKNALDVGSRPYGQSVWSNKPAAIISSSIGTIGGFGATHHLRQCLAYLDMPCMPQPEAYIGGIDKLLDEKGKIKNQDTQAFLQKFMAAFLNWLQIMQQ